MWSRNKLSTLGMNGWVSPWVKSTLSESGRHWVNELGLDAFHYPSQGVATPNLLASSKQPPDPLGPGLTCHHPIQVPESLELAQILSVSSWPQVYEWMNGQSCVLLWKSGWPLGANLAPFWEPCVVWHWSVASFYAIKRTFSLASNFLWTVPTGMPNAANSACFGHGPMLGQHWFGMVGWKPVGLPKSYPYLCQNKGSKITQLWSCNSPCVPATLNPLGYSCFVGSPGTCELFHGWPGNHVMRLGAQLVGKGLIWRK